MKHIFLLTLFFILACNSKNNNISQDSKEIHAIKQILFSQKKCWNNGDINGFMKGYWNSEKLVFTSLKYKPAYGWEATLNRYKESYPTQESMGELEFEVIDILLTSKTTAKLKGKWELTRKKENPNGIFYLDIQKFDDNWLITKDSTISFEL